MPETEKRGPLGYFMPNDLNDPRVNPQLRQRIALEMLNQRSPYAKNLGEGIAAIGKGFEDRAVMDRLAQADIAGSELSTDRIKAILGTTPGSAPGPVAAAEEGGTSAPPVQTASLPPAVAGAQASLPPPPQTRSMAPDIPPAVMENPQGRGIQTPIQPPGSALDPRARAALLLQARMQGGTPVNPTAAGAQTPAVSPPAPAVGGDTDFGSQQRQGVTRDIRTAPPGYEPPSFEPLTPPQKRAIESMIRYPNDTALQDAAKRIYEQEEIGRAQRQKIRDDLRAYNSPAAQLERAKKQAELEKTQLEVRAAKRPKLEKDVEDQTYFNEATQRYERPPMAPDLNAGDHMKEMTADQSKNLQFFEKGYRSMKILGDGKDISGLWDHTAGALPVVGNYAMTQKYQELQAPMAEFANSVLRPETGATITDSDIKNVIARYFPRPGDSAETLAGKKYLRDGHLASLRDGLGKARPNADIAARRIEAEHLRQVEERAARAEKPAAAAAVPGGAPVRITSDAEYNALAPTTRFIGPDGRVRVKR